MIIKIDPNEDIDLKAVENLAETLGIPIQIKESKKAKCKLESYVLQVTKTCSLCGSVSEEYFHMIPEGPYLTSKRIDTLPERGLVRYSEQIVTHCQDCTKNLLMLEREELINKIFNLVTIHLPTPKRTKKSD